MPANAFASTNVYKVRVKDYIEYAFRECGKFAEEQTPQYVDAARQALHYILQDLSNKVTLLFQFRTVLVGARAGQRALPLPEGTVDIRKANYRYAQPFTPTSFLPASNPNVSNLFDRDLSTFVSADPNDNWFGVGFSSPVTVQYIGINALETSTPGARGIYVIYVEYSYDGLNWQPLILLPKVDLDDGEWQYWALDRSASAPYWRIRQDLSNGLLSLRQVTMGSSLQDIQLYRMNIDDYYDLPNKDFRSNRPLQYWFDRQNPSPIMTLWPVPIDDFQLFQLVLEAEMPDLAADDYVIPVPNRWIPYIQGALSSKLAMQLKDVPPDRVRYLASNADMLFSIASSEERDNSSTSLIPDIGAYT